MRNARFWVYWNDTYTKLTLSPGQVIELYACWQTDEGWGSVHESYSLPADEQVVYLTGTNDGRDCDGRLTHTSEVCCPIEDLQSRPAMTHELTENYRLICTPTWKQVRPAVVFDEYAQMAGY